MGKRAFKFIFRSCQRGRRRAEKSAFDGTLLISKSISGFLPIFLLMEKFCSSICFSELLNCFCSRLRYSSCPKTNLDRYVFIRGCEIFFQPICSPSSFRIPTNLIKKIHVILCLRKQFDFWFVYGRIEKCHVFSIPQILGLHGTLYCINCF